MLHISMYDSGDGEMKFFMVKDNSEVVKSLIEKKAGTVFMDLWTTANRFEAEKNNAAIDLEEPEESSRAGKAGKGAFKRRKINIPPPRDEHLQLIIDKIAAWYESESLEAPEGDVGTFDKAPKNLMASDLVRVGITERDDCPSLTVVGVYIN